MKPGFKCTLALLAAVSLSHAHSAPKPAPHGAIAAPSPSAQLQLFTALQGSWNSNCLSKFDYHVPGKAAALLQTRGKATSFLQGSRFFINNLSYVARDKTTKRNLGTYSTHTIYILNPWQGIPTATPQKDSFKKFDFFSYRPFEETYTGVVKKIDPYHFQLQSKSIVSPLKTTNDYFLESPRHILIEQYTQGDENNKYPALESTTHCELRR